MTANLQQWALPRLQQLLPLDDESLKQILTYTETLSKDAAAEHLKNLLGDEPKALEFISGFNVRRQNAPANAAGSSTASTASSVSGVTGREGGSGAAEGFSGRERGGGGARGGRGGKKKANIHALPPRQVANHGNVSGGYVKPSEQDYMPSSSSQKHKDLVADNLALQDRPPDATQLPLITDSAAPTSSKPPPSAAGSLISDRLAPKKSSSNQSSRTSSPAPKTKVNITGGTPMHGASTTLSDLDSAIRSLEIQTNPSLSSTTDSPEEIKKRKCNCMATRHPLLDIAPNCLNCGQIICVKQGMGPCTFCGTPLLSQEEIAKVLRVLKDERGEERMKVNNASHKKADVAHGKTRALTGRDFLAQASSSARSSPLSSAPATPAGSDDEAADKAKQHRDRLLGYQAQNARRTQIHDEAADYDIPTSGTNMWASPAERAQQLKKQQRVLREMQWNARPDYERRRVVASIDLKGGKVVRRMAEVEKPDFSSADVGEDGGGEEDYVLPTPENGGEGRGAFSNNPLAKGLIKPKARAEKGKDMVREKASTWRRVQMDEDDNEQWILDGGIYGGDTSGRILGAEGHAFGGTS